MAHQFGLIGPAVYVVVNVYAFLKMAEWSFFYQIYNTGLKCRMNYTFLLFFFLHFRIYIFSNTNGTTGITSQKNCRIMCGNMTKKKNFVIF